jgi:hypothetical protein
MKKLIQLFVFATLVTTFALPALAQTTPATGTTTTAASGQGDAEAKAALYDKFTKNIKTNPTLAYEAGKEYLQKYEATDGPTDQYIAYIKKWVTSYEKIARRQELLKQLSDKNYNEAFASSKQVLIDFPDDLVVLYPLSGAGLTAATSGNEANNSDAVAYTKRTIQLVQSGKSFDPAKPLTPKERDEMLNNLNYALGFLLRKTAPNEAATYFINAAQLEGPHKTNPYTYYFLASAYEETEYSKLRSEYEAKCKTDEQLNSQECKDLTAKVNQVLDRMIDGLARAIAYSNTASNPAQFAQARTAWTEQITTLYKYRNNGSDTGLKELIASITSRPLPKPGEPVAPLTPQTAPSSTTAPGQPSGTTGTPAGKATTSTTTAATGTKQGTTSATTGSKTMTPQPAGKTSSTKTTPRRSH